MSFWSKLFGKSLATSTTPQRSNAPSSTLAKYMSDKRSYAQDCLHCDWVEVEDTRRWSDYPEFKRIREMANNGQDTEALTLIDNILPKHKDHYFVYMWKIILLARLRRLPEAENTFAAGLANCQEKYTLCSNWAEIEYEARHLSEAVRWWIRSIVSEYSLHTPQSEGAFLYLAYVAKFLGEPASEQKLFAVVDRLTSIGRYNDEEQRQIRTLVSAQGNGAIKEAIALLCTKHLQ